MPVTRDRPAPYAPASAILEIVQRYRSRGLIFPINSDVLARVGIAESLIPRTLQALQTLDLFNESGNPTETLEGIRVAPEAEYKTRLGDWLKAAYADVFAFVDPTTDDETRIRDAFRSYQPIGQQNRMVTLFQGLCAAAGLIADKPVSASRSRAVTTRVVRAPQVVRTPQVVRKDRVLFSRNSWDAEAERAATASMKLLSTNRFPAITGLLESLPQSGWTKETRDKFIRTFEAVLDFSIPIKEAIATQIDDDGGQE